VYATTGEQRLLDMVEKTLIAMGTKGMYDLVAGGWFRYSTTPDWSVPHFEKMLEDHARLLSVYLDAILAVRDGSGGGSGRGSAPERSRSNASRTLARIVQSSLDYLSTTLLHDEPGLTYFAGSQDADEDYYLLSRDERARVQAPFIDWRLYSDWNAWMVSSLLQASVVLDQTRYADLAAQVWHTLVERCVTSDGSVTHSLVRRDGSLVPATLRGQLRDQAAVALASLDLAQHVPDVAGTALGVARDVLAFALRELIAEDGGFHDSPANPDASGMLRVRIKPIFDNCEMAEALLTLSFFEHGEAALASRALAMQTLNAFREEYKRYREHGAPYALAVIRATTEPAEVMVVAKAVDALPFVRAAHANSTAWRIVRVLDPEDERDAGIIRERGYPVRRLPVAFVCRGTTCSAPIFDPAQLNG
jgi:uncharacterized protein YyaL (SSP411 family)